ncbi:MAG: hypothetical protein IKL47_00655 [Clostridia bacterium]|nr:hypothetical protein [Clostridia bacterium]
MKKVIAVFTVILMMLSVMPLAVFAAEATHEHTPAEPVLEVEWEATCTESGRYKYVTNCAECGKFLTFRRENVPALGHDFAAATCTAPETCTRCGETRGEDLGGHIMPAQATSTEVEYEPTCMEEGRMKLLFNCERCEKLLTIKREAIEALGHTLPSEPTSSEVEYEPTCMEEGRMKHYYNCEVCGNLLTIKRTAIEAKGHTLPSEPTSSEVEYEPTCMEEGRMKHYYNCVECGKLLTIKRTAIEAKGHTLPSEPTSSEVEYEPTCMEEGRMKHYYNCEVCGKLLTIKRTPIEAKGHVLPAEPSETVVEFEVTCTEDGVLKHIYNCEDCGEFLTFKRETVEALGHDFTAPTCTAPSTCTVCGETEGESLGGHVMGEPVVEDYKAPTATESGSYKNVFYCTVCGKLLTKRPVVLDPVA